MSGFEQVDRHVVSAVGVRFVRHVGRGSRICAELPEAAPTTPPRIRPNRTARRGRIPAEQFGTDVLLRDPVALYRGLVHHQVVDEAQGQQGKVVAATVDVGAAVRPARRARTPGRTAGVCQGARSSGVGRSATCPCPTPFSDDSTPQCDRCSARSPQSRPEACPS